MKFKEWLKEFEKEDTPIGDLSRDVYCDDSFPVSDDYETIRKYLENAHVSDACIATFEDAFKRYSM